MTAYAAFSVVFGEQPSAAKWNILGTNDSSFNDGTGIGNGVIFPNHLFAAASTLNTWVYDTWSPTWTGFSVNPTVVATYIKVGKTVILFGRNSATGTSNAVTTTITNAPFTSRNLTNMFWFGWGYATDASTTQTNQPRVYISSNSTTIQFEKNQASANWTASGSKAIDFTLIYEAI